MTWQKWTPEEDDAIRELWNSHTAIQIAEQLSRTESSVRNRISQLGLAETLNDWTTEELDKLKSLYRILSYDDLSVLLNRTQSSIHHKVMRLGLTKWINDWEYEQMTPSLAHLLGMALTDGCLHYSGKSGTLVLTHTAIDPEYVEASIDAFASECGKTYKTPRAVGTNENFRGKQPWTVDLVCADLNHWIAEQIDWKKKFPVEMWKASRESQLSFAAAMLDGDGWIAEQKHPKSTSLRYKIGFCSESKWIYEFSGFLKSLGISSGKMRTEILKSGKEFYTLSINHNEFVQGGGYFRIERKMARLQRFAESHSDLFPQRPHVPPLPKRMIWSGLHSDMQRVVEIATPRERAEQQNDGEVPSP